MPVYVFYRPREFLSRFRRATTADRPRTAPAVRRAGLSRDPPTEADFQSPVAGAEPTRAGRWNRSPRLPDERTSAVMLRRSAAPVEVLISAASSAQPVCKVATAWKRKSEILLYFDNKT